MDASLRSKLSALGPGILTATAAVGGSHLIASTQAGALYGWQLAIIIILANVFKYPFFRFGFQYTLDTGNTLLEGYAQKSRWYLWLFFLLNIFSSMVNTAAVAMIAAVILQTALPDYSVEWMTFAVLLICSALILAGRYHLLDRLSKVIMVLLAVTTIAAVVIAAGNERSQIDAQLMATPWNLAALGFIVTLMGWMPAPIEISVISSLWLKAKQKDQVEHQEPHLTKQNSLFDFNVGYWGTAVLALFFLGIGALVQYGAPEGVERVGGAYVRQLISMYVGTIGEWSRWLVTFIAFACMFGTTLTILDGYSRTNAESLRLIRGHNSSSPALFLSWVVVLAFASMLVVFFFKGALGPMLKFAMITAFITTPVFAWLNFSLVRHDGFRLKGWLSLLSWIGLAYLTLFTLFFLVYRLLITA
ncbi:MAG: divalent metal cation transporter [Pseudomonadota bacterium]|nr:divalent metal cation transporter [Pseudomonadota bacterium]